MTQKQFADKYKNLLHELTLLINKADPYCLIKCAKMPEDEYSREVSMILVGLRKCDNFHDVSALISSTFNSQFEDTRSPSDYSDLAKEIFDWYTHFPINSGEPLRSPSVSYFVGKWVDSDFDSGLIQRCKEAWDKPISELTNEELATFLRQNIAVSQILPEAVKRLEINYDDDSEFYDGELKRIVAEIHSNKHE
jgi:hypothetical protein